ncbi:acyltransferase [uncultured Serinicoccus sp.]|uniref:acyltransferase family protein n=1 Tax=uncultured Serinicoccus sp. TaxID=735514 RepID=UPI002603E30E|nr:acyltransferase [uncultured Serinicoccus sp.]
MVSPTPDARTNAGRAGRPGSLLDLLDPRSNSLNAIRLVLASSVIVSHAPMIVSGDDPYAIADLDVGGWAVAGFFVVSGWLIASSRMSTDFAPFMWRRLIRIMPAFWVALLITAAVFAPMTWLSDEGERSPVSALTYVVKNAGLWIFQPTIDGTLIGNPVSTWNESLWTLSWEMLCYLGIALVFFWGTARTRPWPVLLLWGAATAATVVIRETDWVSISTGSAVGQGARLGSYFLAGAALRMMAHRVPGRATLAAACVVALAVMAWFGVAGALIGAPMAYLSIYLGAVLPLRGVARTNDISYGIYIYGFPVGQLLAFYAGGLGVVQSITLNVLLVIPLAWMSWLWVESPAMRLKSLVPSRRGPAPAAARAQPESPSRHVSREE